MERRPLAFIATGVVLTILGMVLAVYTKTRLVQTGYFLSDMRIHVIVTHPYLELGIVIIIIGISAVVVGLVIKE